VFEIGDLRKQLHKENAKLTGQLWCSKAVIYVNNYKKETCVEKTGAIKFIERQDIFVNQLYLIFTQNMETRTLGKLCTLYTLISAILAQTWTRYMRNVSFLPPRAIR